MPKIVVDAMGSDKHPDPEITATIDAAKTFGDEIILVGVEPELRTKLPSKTPDNFKIIHAPDVFNMSDKLSGSMLRKAQDSMAIGLQLLKNGEADAFVTMGNTGGAMAHGLYQLKRIRGVKRPALSAIFPVKNGRCVVLDIGANTECKPEYLYQFAVMGSLYAEAVLGVSNPRVGLLSNGEEAGKGNELVKETYPLLSSSGMNFVGNVEGKELFGGEADVVVTDGFTGNILTKSSEAVAKLITDILRIEMTSSMRTKLGAVLAKPAFNGIKKMLDPSEVGAAPLLGLNGLVFVGHGRSNSRAVYNAIQLARKSVQAKLLDSIRSQIELRIQKITYSS